MGSVDSMANNTKPAKGISIQSHKPGSIEAIRAGCRCDPYKNFYGNGVTTIVGGEPAKVYFPDDDCPIHATGEADDDSG